MSHTCDDQCECTCEWCESAPTDQTARSTVSYTPTTDDVDDVIRLLTNLIDKVARPNLSEQANSQGEPMSKYDEAVEAGARAILSGATIDSFYVQGDWEAAGYDVQQSMLKAARDALDAALAILCPDECHDKTYSDIPLEDQ